MAPRDEHCCDTRPCGCGRLLRGMMRPALLLLLAEGQADYGYELHQGLQQLGLDVGDDLARVYRALRKLEAEGLVQSEWDTSGTGPARRVYMVTAEGMRFLGHATDDVEQAVRRLSVVGTRLRALLEDGKE